MYKTAVPITNRFPDRELDCEGTLAELKRLGAKRVWLCTARGIESERVLSEELELLKKHRLFFEENGLEVGAWLSSLGHGGRLAHDDTDLRQNAGRYQKIIGLSGESCEDGLCPSDENFLSDYSEWIGRIAETGVRMIMIDDDYRLSIRPCGPGCFCDKHAAEYARRVGEKIECGRLPGLVFSGKPNRYREAWLEMGRDALMGLARRIRERVDRVDPDVRVGVCSVMSTWGNDGVDAIELTRALAGRTPPFLRTIGAPYWSASNMSATRLSYVIEMARLQRHWCENAGVELFTEGDAYPRPRYATPASFLEMYDMALRADGGFDGILKYALDYTSSPRYERGYADLAERHAAAYDWIARHMASGRAEGADVVCAFNHLKSAEIPAGMTPVECHDEYFYSAASRLLADCGVPAAYGTRGAHVVCGENGCDVPLEYLDDGMVLDVIAAERLTRRGVDVGLRSVGPLEPAEGVEHYLADDEYVATGGVKRFADVTLADGAQVLSLLGKRPCAYRYENAAGQRFLVYAFDMWSAANRMGMLRAYCRQKQLIEGLEWVGRRKLPAVCTGWPDLYILCKRTGEGLAVGLWNLSADSVYDARVALDRAYGTAEFFGCAGRLDGDAVVLSGEVHPFEFAGVLLRD